MQLLNCKFINVKDKMMRVKIYLTTAAFLLPVFIFGQVGINTANPSAGLDVVSTGSTSATKALEVNNSANAELMTILDNGNVGINVPAPTAKLHTNGSVIHEALPVDNNQKDVLVADASGKISKRTTESLLPKIIAGGNIGDPFTNTVTISAIGASSSTTQEFFVTSFTIDKTSMVNINLILSANLKAANGAPFTTNNGRSFGTRVYFKNVPSGNSYAAGGTIMRLSTPYNSGSAAGYVAGYFYLSGSKSIVMTPGTYEIDIEARVLVNTADTQGLMGMFCEATDDRFDIVAVPLDL